MTIDGAPQTTDSCPALDPGASYSGSFDGPLTCSDGSDTIEVCADTNDEVAESNESNNCKQNEWSCSTQTFDIGNGAGNPGDTDRRVELSLTNAVPVSGIQVDICDAGTLSLPSVDDIELTARTAGFTVDFEDDFEENGCVRLVLYSQEGSLLDAGDGPILILRYDVDPSAGANSCAMLTSQNLLITDVNDNPLTAAEDPGGFFFGIYGDPWPYDSVSGTVGDRLVNIFDVVRDIQILIETYTPTSCEFVAGDVPTGAPPDCVAPDEVINIQDVLVMVVNILGRDNCIDGY
ncbi:MAG: CARDB domain-containing protein [Thermodesulfobacteriota bacterium]|nr:CARDB domain-containing protein [Thermodesulfobacteriota bacterium]